MRGSRSARLAAAITVAALVNAAMLSAILFQRVAVSWPSAEPTPALKLDLSRPLPTTRPPKIGASARRRTPSPANPSTASTPVPPAPPSPVPLPPAIRSAPPPAVSPAPGADDVQARASAALRALQACNDLADPSHVEARCGRSWQDPAESVDALSPAERAGFAAARPDMDARMARSAAIRRALVDHSGEGSSFHYGCTVRGGHIQCGTY